MKDNIKPFTYEDEAPYYHAYETRYQKVYAAGVPCWGHTSDDETLTKFLTDWVDDNNLRGKSIIEYACGEGSSGVILSKLGCTYHGVDIAASALEKAGMALDGYPSASVSELDMVRERMTEKYDAALDVMGLHMLVTDEDRGIYLSNVYMSLKQGAPALFFRESYRRDAYSGMVNSYEEWKSITGSDYTTPEPRTVMVDGAEHTVEIPLIPARAKNKEDYIREMNEAGFEVVKFVEMDINEQCVYSASIYVIHK